ncbi:Bgt-51294, partial [Blumeria graminis f. sp. tritici]
DQIISYVESSPGNRRKTYLELASGPLRHLGVSERIIQKELEKRISATYGSSRASSILVNYEDAENGPKLISIGHMKTQRQFYAQTKLG